METIQKQSKKIIGQEDILIDVAMKDLWPFIHNSKLLELWIPFVHQVEVYPLKDGKEESLGTLRKIHFLTEGIDDFLIEYRIEHVEGKKVTYCWSENINWIIAPDIVGYSFELQPFRYNQTRLIFTYYQNSEEIKHPFIKAQTSLLTALKAFAENLA